MRETAWLTELDVNGSPHVALPQFDGRPVVVGGREHPARFEVVSPLEASATNMTAPALLPVPRPVHQLRRLRVQPSAARAPDPSSS